MSEVVGPPADVLFADVIGQPRAVAFLSESVSHPVHAYLFLGPAGAGSLAAARAFGTALLCPNGGCANCETCRRAMKGSHPDLVVIDRTGASLSVDDAQRLVGLAQRTPFEATRQVLIVRDVQLAVRSAPALLKTIEEPPRSTFFLLLADDVPPELVTVASRCVEVPFPPIPTAAIVAKLENDGVDHATARMVADGADGDLDRALLLAGDGGFADRLGMWQSIPGRIDGRGATATTLAKEILGAAEAALGPLRARHASELSAMDLEAKAMGERTMPGKKDFVERQNREARRWRTDEIRAGLGVLSRAYRDRLVDSVLDSRDGQRSSDEELRGYESAISWITDSTRALRRNAQETLLLEALFVRLGSVKS